MWNLSLSRMEFPVPPPPKLPNHLNRIREIWVLSWTVDVPHLSNAVSRQLMELEAGEEPVWLLQHPR